MRYRFWIALFFVVQIYPIFAEGETGIGAEPPKETLGETKPPPASEEKPSEPVPEPKQKTSEIQPPSGVSEIHLIAGGGVSLNQSFSSIISLGWGGLIFTRFEYEKFSLALAAETGLYNSRASQLESSQFTIHFEKGQSVGYSNFGVAAGYRIFDWQGLAFDLGLGGGYATLSVNAATISRNFFIQVLPGIWYSPWPNVKVALRTALYYTFVNEPEIDGKKYPLFSVENVIDARIQLLVAYAVF